MPIATPQGTLDFKSVDKVTFVGASSNTVIDTTTGSLGVGVGVGGPTSNLHVVGHTRLEGDINMLHTSNTSSMKVNSNVVTEFPRSKKLIKYPRVAMTQNDESGTSGYVTNASSWENQANNETYGPWNNSNGILNDSGWQSYPRRFSQSTGDWDGTTTAPYAISLVGGNTIYGEWVELKIPNKIQLHTCRISPIKSTTYPNLGKHRSPRDGYILGRVGATGNWTILKSWSDLIHGWEDLVLRDFDIENPSEYYDYFRVVWTAINGNNNYSTSAGAGYASSGEIEFLGVPEYDPEAHGTDVVVKSVPNVPNTDWLEVYYDAKDLADGSITNVDDLTPNGTNDGTATNVTVSDGAFVFNGTSDIRSTVSTFTGDQPHTMSVWVNISTLHTLSDGYICILAPSTGEATDKVSSIRYQNDGFSLQSWGNDVQMYNLGIQKDRWYHLVAVYDGGGVTTSSKRLYIDTLQNLQISYDGTTSNPINFTNTTLSLGSRVDGISSHLTGSIANFRLFNRPLTTDEIYQLYAYQKEYFGHGDLSMTLKAGRLGIGTSEPKAALDVRGPVRIYDTELTNLVYAEFSTNYATTGLSDEQIAGWRDPANNILDFNVVTRQSSHNAFDADSALGVRGSFTVPHDGVYVVYYAALINRVSTTSHIYVHVNGSNANGTGINSHQNRNTIGSTWITLTIQRVLRLKRGDKVQCYITGGFYTLNNYSFGSIYQIGA